MGNNSLKPTVCVRGGLQQGEINIGLTILHCDQQSQSYKRGGLSPKRSRCTIE